MLTVTNYHYVRNDFSSDYPSIFGVTPEVFENQLSLLQKTGKFIDSNELINNAEAIITSKESYYLVTFDDGLKEQYKLALPILDTLNIPAIFFVNSYNHSDKKVSQVHKIHLLRSILSPEDIITKFNLTEQNSLSVLETHKATKHYIYDDSKTAELKYLLNFKFSNLQVKDNINSLFKFFFDEEKVVQNLYMNTNELKNLSKRGMLGSHTHSHKALGLLAEDEIEFELTFSKQYLENLTESKINLIAYPYGSKEACTAEVAFLAKKVGYDFGFTTNQEINSDLAQPLLLHRFDCNDLLGGKNYKI